ncbi:hypothetical protein [Paenisporosarcina cavernae]|uniref:Uncharacterized protein n=1 Tax=Paenisporosarcina cavernae TaxID=2320858 RepID=A0A385YY40_9BACL|nr:hypothetical protein [Paenisporosarcina cavernae]AYC30538.1 hypothetical protein D3873_12115 [Paenisporosarcina cavernae]
MKYIGIFIGVLIMTFLLFLLAGMVFNASSTDESSVLLIVIALQNAVIISFLLYMALAKTTKVGIRRKKA